MLALLSAAACGEAKGAGPDRVLEHTYATAVAALDAAAGIRLEHTVPVVLLTRQEALERRRTFAAGLAQGAGATRSVDQLVDVFLSGGNFVGKYFPDEHVVYVFKDVLGDDWYEAPRESQELFSTVTHELVHAHDDQVYDVIPDPLEVLARLAADDASQLESQAVLMAILEGHATWATELACQKVGHPAPRPLTMEDVRNVDAFDGDGQPLLDGLAAAGNVIVGLKYLQYVQGREFCRRAMTFGGEPFMREVFTHLPVSREELADFDLFKLRWAAQKEAELDAPSQAKPSESGG